MTSSGKPSLKELSQAFAEIEAHDIEVKVVVYDGKVYRKVGSKVEVEELNLGTEV